jgi:hypothetical protein
MAQVTRIMLQSLGENIKPLTQYPQALHQAGLFFTLDFALALTMLGYFCFHHFQKMIVLRRGLVQPRFFQVPPRWK